MFFKKFSSAFSRLTSCLLMSMQFCFWSSLSRHGTNLAVTWCVLKFSVRISWRVVFEIPAFSATSRTVIWHLEQITFQTWFMFSSFFDVQGRPEHSLYSTEVWPSWKHFYHSGVVLYSWCHPQILVLTFQRSLKTFSLIWNKISHKHVAQENHLFIIVEKFTEQASTFTLIDTVQWLSKLEWSSLWHSLRKRTGMQHSQWTSLHFHSGALIQKFGNFTDWLRMLE